jgi:hypothetical protein
MKIALLLLVVAVAVGIAFRPTGHKPVKQTPYIHPVYAPLLHPDGGFGRPHTLAGGF